MPTPSPGCSTVIWLSTALRVRISRKPAARWSRWSPARRSASASRAQSSPSCSTASSPSRKRPARVEAFAADRFHPEAARGLRRGDFGPSWSRNDVCTVFRVSLGDHSFLITADASIRRWTHLIKRLLG
jgi:hypothetical protein